MESTNTVKIFVGCLPADTVEEELYDYFSQFCSITSFKIKFRSNKVCAGYGHFLCPDSNHSALENFFRTPHYYQERSLEVRKYLTGDALEEYQEEFNKRRVYIRNLPPGVTDRTLGEIFQKFGQVERAYMANNPDKEGIHFGFVVFAKQGIIE